MLDRLRSVLPQSSEAPPQLQLTNHEPEHEGSGFQWRESHGMSLRLDGWAYQYRVRPITGGWEAVIRVYGRPHDYSCDEFKGENARQDAIEFCETHARVRLAYTNEEKAMELERIAPAKLACALKDAALVQGRAYERGGDIVFYPNESRWTVDLDGEGVEL